MQGPIKPLLRLHIKAVMLLLKRKYGRNMFKKNTRHQNHGEILFNLIGFNISFNIVCLQSMYNVYS